ncbi:unnamed protein product [Strongylus vulgaris]|uniref:Glycine-rich protein n=1 Tax=Strongylus vulgaris TaxID=40348 RepID=A0A3P7L7Y2_STRVU|nr:unnamed protein product [Strongylus vulgaris]
MSGLILMLIMLLAFTDTAIANNEFWMVPGNRPFREKRSWGSGGWGGGGGGGGWGKRRGGRGKGRGGWGGGGCGGGGCGGGSWKGKGGW